MWLHPDIQSSTFSVSAGDRLLFYTDGLLEARDRAGRYFRLEDCLDTLRYPDLQAAVDGLLDRLLAHAGRKLHDDVALLLLEATSPPVRPGQDGGRWVMSMASRSADREIAYLWLANARLCPSRAKAIGRPPGRTGGRG